ncbi:hypothetical protein RSOLAG1IB_00055 [Rhizoctonia solani AG-1 IB]|uniref:Tyrosinase copper-binding domain-containing protein n=1 Tax=Thanatephorus cucumeris (strain AG1-IB / isolate 7/3/14) TaxID=1108050 RepID=A0A0B7F1Z6_THACB|nr:hypothetical protein RSOLAG1IB_00055 [Rhizoctonia solani AG-1 IB]
MKLATAFNISLLAAFVAAAEQTQSCSSLEVRKEWRSFSKTERKAWVDAVNCLNKAPSNGKLTPPIDTDSLELAYHIAPFNASGTYYDDLVYAHMNLNPVIHHTGLFLPWHRAYTHEWTNALRSECGYTGVVPYSEDLLGSEIWDTDSEAGLGGFSDDETDDYTLHTGALNIDLSYPTPHKLRRHYYPQPWTNSNRTAVSTFTPAEIQKLLATSDGNFTQFQGYLESTTGMHAAVHLMMGGDMGTRCPAGTQGTIYCPSGNPTFSASEPMFHLHHANVDRLWWLWQEKNSINKYAFHGGSVQNRSSSDIYPNGQPPWLNKTDAVPSAGLWDVYTIEQTLDTRSWPWCYVYDQ